MNPNQLTVACREGRRSEPRPRGLSGVLKILVPAIPAICTPFFSDFWRNFFQFPCFYSCSFPLAARVSNFFSFFFRFRSFSSSSSSFALRLAEGRRLWLGGRALSEEASTCSVVL